MKKLLLLSAIALVATSASALEVKPYVEGKINHNWLKAEVKADDMKKDFKDNMFGGALEVGAKIDQFRIGLEGQYNDKAKKTKFDWAEILGHIEFKVHIDNTVIYEGLRQIDTWGYLNEGDIFEVWFDIPQNKTTNSREVFVKANEISSEDFWDKSYVIGDDALWDIVWQGKQLAP